MDKNNNNTQNSTEVSDLVSIASDAKHPDPKILVAIVIMLLLVVGIVITMLAKTQDQVPVLVEPVIPVAPEVTTPIKPTVPEKVITGKALPEGFPKELILEDGININEAYTLPYGEESKKQLTATFISQKTAKDNFTAYEKYLTDQYWIILNKHEADKVNSLYAMKSKQIINITIESNGTTTSSLSISLSEN